MKTNSGITMPVAPSRMGADLPVSGSVAIHGRQMDILPSGKALLYVRPAATTPASRGDGVVARWALA